MSHLPFCCAVVFIITGLANSEDSNCGPESICRCNWASLQVNCTNAHIVATQLGLLPANASQLILDGGFFPHFNISQFFRFSNLSKLSIQNSYISTIEEPSSPDSLPPLDYLDLSNNGISEIKTKDFIPMTLKYLYLGNNSISSMTGEALQGLVTSSVTHLDLSNNKLALFPKFETQLQSSIIYFNLSGNSLAAFLDNISVAENLFHRFKQIRTLDLSRNHIEELHHFLLADMTNLMDLYLNENDITDLDQISLRSDEHKIVTFNHWGQDSPIFWFPHGLFALRFINLAHNKIRRLDVKIFSIDNLPSLKSIDLSFNPFVCDAETYMFFEAYVAVQMRSAHCHKNKSELCITFPRNSFPKNFQVIGISNRNNDSGYFCEEPPILKRVHVMDYDCTGTCRTDYIKLLPQYQTWKQEEELLHTDASLLSSGFSISITLAVLTVLCFSLLIVCYKLDLWRRITGQMRYRQVRRNLLQLEGGDDAVI